MGDFGRAAELLRQSVEAADREAGTLNNRRIQARAWLARTLGQLGAFAEGWRHGEEVLRLATLGSRGVVQAHAALAAIDLYRAMDMTLWLPQAEAALTQVEGQ